MNASAAAGFCACEEIATPTFTAPTVYALSTVVPAKGKMPKSSSGLRSRMPPIAQGPEMVNAALLAEIVD